MSKRIVITGASTGIGAETARHLAENNEIIVHYHTSEQAAQEVAKSVEAAGGKAYCVRADLSREADCIQLADFTARTFPHLDVLVNNAGSLVKRMDADQIDWQIMQQTFALNVFSVFKLTCLLIPLLKKRQGSSIVNVTSIAMRHGAPTATVYGASKAALDSYTRGLAKELAPHIRVNAVAPGVIETPFHERFSTPERMENFRQATPLLRNGKPVHIASAIKLLIDNDFITGATIDVNGGLFMQ
jgi:3-oxoacyl-[acyl-carrier protein] reductase